MQVSSPFHQILYVSHLAATYEYDVFASICHVARHRNAQLSLTGVLLFDGHRFCQLLQGPELAVQAMMPDIARDRRHERLVMLFDGAIAAQTAQRSWAVGYCDAHELDIFDAPDGARGDAAMAALRAILPRADLSP
jgi:Sensors of blue-light using FAD